MKGICEHCGEVELFAFRPLGGDGQQLVCYRCLSKRVEEIEPISPSSRPETPSRSIQRRVAAMKGEPAPTFSSGSNVPDETAHALERLLMEVIKRARFYKKVAPSGSDLQMYQLMQVEVRFSLSEDDIRRELEAALATAGHQETAPDPAARQGDALLRALARDSAKREHVKRAMNNEFITDYGIHVFIDGADLGFSVCPHPDCVLVRPLAPSDQEPETR